MEGLMLHIRRETLHDLCREQERLPWSEEVLVSRADLNETRRRIAELEAQVCTFTL